MVSSMALQPFLLFSGDADLNPRPNWNSRKTSFEGDAIENLTSRFGLHQVIKEPALILDTSASCIDLIFTSQPNLIIESGVHSFFIYLFVYLFFPVSLHFLSYILKSFIVAVILHPNTI